MSSFSMLLENKELLQKPQQKVKIKRLSTEGNDFTLTCEALNSDQVKKVNEISGLGKVSQNGEINTSSVVDIQLNTIAEGVIEFNLKKNKDEIEALKEGLGLKGTPGVKELITKVLMPGEIGTLYETIQKLSEGEDGDVEELKNE